MGQADPGDVRRFLMPRAAKRILDPSVTVVTGARGSGKSSFAAWLAHEGMMNERGARRAASLGLPFGFRCDAFSQRGTNHPDVLVLDAFVREASDEALRNFWLKWLVVRTVASVLPFDNSAWDEETQQLVADLAHMGRTAPANLANFTVRERAAWIDLLDSAERKTALTLASSGAPHDVAALTFLYDDLDTVGAFDPLLRARFIRALLAMWTTFSTRYKHLRAKIFLPSDLFDLRLFDTLDVSKLMARAERLEWDTASLYRLALRHLGAEGEDVRAWLASFGVVFRDEGNDGWMPDEPSEEVTRRWLTATLRAIVSAHGTRSHVDKWIANRLRDGRDRIAPRSMLDFFRESARFALRRPPRPTGNLLAVDDAVEAIVKVGKLRVDEIRAVYPWVDRLEHLCGRAAPIARRELESLLKSDAPTAHKATEPRDGETVTTELVRLGMLREIGGRDVLDVPDLFAKHWGVVRQAPDAGAPAS